MGKLKVVLARPDGKTEVVAAVDESDAARKLNVLTKRIGGLPLNSAVIVTPGRDVNDLRASVTSAQQRATIRAALKHYKANGQGDPSQRDNDIHELATDGDSVISLDDDGIEELYAQFENGRPSR